MKKYYVVYEYIEEQNDIRNVAEFEERKSLSNWLGVRMDNLAKSTTKTIENLPRLIKDKYFIMIEKDIEE